MNEKKKSNRKLVYLIAILLLFLLIAGSVGLATWAVLKTQHKGGGNNINYEKMGALKVTVTHATVEGATVLKDGATLGADDYMKQLTISPGQDAFQGGTDTWQNLMFELLPTTAQQVTAKTLTITFKIQNQHESKDLQVTISDYDADVDDDSETTYVENKIKSRKLTVTGAGDGTYELVEPDKNAEDYDGATPAPITVTIAPGTEATVTITIVPEPNHACYINGFGYNLSFTNVI